ncbi:MAG: 2-amino-4-hydroxy-6-hydroxymethyldihydropteridine diphosphokinase [Terriglobia bacterium]
MSKDPRIPIGKGTKRVYLSLGSNLGDRAAQIGRALHELNAAGIEVIQISAQYRTEPVDYRAQSWFTNCVAEVHTNLMPLQLLRALQSIERGLGRKRGLPKGPRPIDIDILFFENAVVRSATLTIPHERLAERKFVLVPLREIAPNLRHPVTQQTVVEMLSQTRDTSKVIRLKAES